MIWVFGKNTLLFFPHWANVVFLVLDDIGFGGLSYNNFHTTGICSPTRACLLTGRNFHSVGVGSLMEFPAGYPGYTT